MGMASTLKMLTSTRIEKVSTFEEAHLSTPKISYPLVRRCSNLLKSEHLRRCSAFSQMLT
jgi:hypothetical protein